MATQSQITANIANAQHSAGPITAVGKAHSAVNSTKLGLYAKQAVLLTDADRSAFEDLTNSLQCELSPQTAIEQTFLAQIVLATWNLQRANRLESALSLSEGVDPLLSTNPTFARIATFRLRAERSLHKCLSEYRKIKAERQTIVEEPEALTILQNEPNHNTMLMEKSSSGFFNQNLNPKILRIRTNP